MDHFEVKLELLEVLLNNILYLREVYPQKLFRKRKVYNLPLPVSIYPPLNSYLTSILKTAKELKEKLYKVELVIYKEQDSFAIQIIENFVFELKGLKIQESDEYLQDFEDEVRRIFQTLESRNKVLKKLPKNCKFKILLHTSEMSYLKISSDSNFQDFLWIKEQKQEQFQNEPKIIPVSDNLWFFLETR